MLPVKTFIYIVGLFLFVALGLAAMRPGNGKPKNLKVLPKDISEDSLFTIMKTFELSLGVKCNFCHIVNEASGREDYASDSILVKDECRYMMLMTDSINKKYFYQPGPPKITCFTCHHGQKVPGSDVIKSLWR